MTSRQCMSVTLLCAAMSCAGQLITPQRAALVLRHAPASTSCEVVGDEASMEAALKKLRYAGNLPDIPWNTSKAVIVWSKDGAVMPQQYAIAEDGGAVVFYSGSAPTTQYMYVMTVDPKVKTGKTCTLLHQSLVAQAATKTLTPTASTPPEVQSTMAAAPAPKTTASKKTFILSGSSLTVAK